MNARALDMLHDARDEYIGAVGDNVDLELGAHHIFIDEHGILDAAR